MRLNEGGSISWWIWKAVVAYLEVLIIKISIIIPIGPNKSADSIISSLNGLDYPKKDMEILVVEGTQPAKQRNEAIAKANGEVLFFFDDDVTVEPDIIKKMLKHYEDNKVAIVGGPNLTPKSDSFIQKCFGYVMESSFGTAGMHNRYKADGIAREATEKDLILCNLSARKSVLEKEGAFVESLYPNEENELFNRLQANGHKLIYDPEAIVYHSRRSSVKAFIKQNFNYGRGRMEQSLIQPSSFKILFVAPTIFTLYLVLLPLIKNKIYLIPLFLYLLLSVAIGIKISWSKKDPKLLPLLPWMFSLVHVPYGLGFVYGLFSSKYYNKRRGSTIIKIKEIKLSEM
jgi:cellulose synthase/poly-beta-1,6-N-acetylglucosamine synthase-like glycosyltransferase